jgi:hypothetical protein
MASNGPRGTSNRSQKRGHGLEALPRLTARLDVPRPAVAKASVAAKAAVAESTPRLVVNDWWWRGGRRGIIRSTLVLTAAGTAWWRWTSTQKAAPIKEAPAVMPITAEVMPTRAEAMPPTTVALPAAAVPYPEIILNESAALSRRLPRRLPRRLLLSAEPC